MNSVQESKRYFKRELGGIVRLTNDVTVHSLDLMGNWILNQDLISMFVDGTDSYYEISEEEVNYVINERKNDNSFGRKK